MAGERDIFGDDPEDDMDLDDGALAIGKDPEDDFGDELEQGDSRDTPAEAPSDDRHDDARDDAPAVDIARQADQAARKSRAEDVAQQWDAEVKKRRAAYEEAEAEAAKAEEAYVADSIDTKTKLAAINRMVDARQAVREAEQMHAQAVGHVNYVASERANPAADTWIAANPRFTTDPKFAESVRVAAKALEDDGMNPSHPKFYAELDRRLKRTPPMNRQGRTQSGAPVTSGAQGRDTTPRLTDKDKAELRAWGLVTPGMPKEKRIAVAKEYLRQKAIANTERRAG